MRLPLDCTAEYQEAFISIQESAILYDLLINNYRIDTLKTEIIHQGKASLSDHGKMMFIDQDLYDSKKFPEEAWGKTAIWSKELLKIKQKVEQHAQRIFNVCVCIYYPDGNTGVDFHSDYVAFGDTTVIPSISLGEERDFLLRNKETQEIYSIELKNGSMIVMGENCQERYEHSLPTHPKYKKGRINLTFRQYGFH